MNNRVTINWFTVELGANYSTKDEIAFDTVHSMSHNMHLRNVNVKDGIESTVCYFVNMFQNINKTLSKITHHYHVDSQK